MKFDYFMNYKWIQSISKISVYVHWKKIVFHYLSIYLDMQNPNLKIVLFVQHQKISIIH